MLVSNKLKVGVLIFFIFIMKYEIFIVYMNCVKKKVNEKFHFNWIEWLHQTNYTFVWSLPNSHQMNMDAGASSSFSFFYFHSPRPNSGKRRGLSCSNRKNIIVALSHPPPPPPLNPGLFARDVLSHFSPMPEKDGS